MNIHMFVFLSLLCLALVGSANSYGILNYDPLGTLIQAQKSSKSLDSFDISKENGGEYSPVYVGSQEGLKDADRISVLPGQSTNDLGFDQYSGYVTVDPKAGRALFYYFTESPNSSAKPLVLWLNGGPGCSSFGNGAMMELGPFRVSSDGKTLWHNEYSWNTAANVLFLESPAGVGFSYSNTTSDYVTGDKRTATDSYMFLINWLERYPEYKTRDLFIVGESYAGHYVPQLAQLILQNNKITNQTVINLKGIGIGNAYIDYETRWTGYYDHLWSHAFISDETHTGIVQNCNFSSTGSESESCANYENEVDLGNIYIYDTYAPRCLPNSSNIPSISGFDPCTENYIDTYLNTPQVQEALHVTGVPRQWDSCNYDINFNWQDKPLTVLPVIKELMASGIAVWIYSGDTDGIIPVTSTRYSINKLGLSVKTSWYPWYTQGQVGGYAVGYENLNFVTIRGSGHFVPSYQPARALTFFTSFLEGKLPPSR